jgi:acetyl esterase/lipase
MKRVMLGLLLAALWAPVALGADETKGKKYDVLVVKDVVYNPDKEPDERHKLDLYLPHGAKDYPVFVFIHGGGWRGGSKNGAAGIGVMFANHGVGLVSVGYRLSPKIVHPEHIKDIAQAFAWVFHNMGKRGANVKQVFVGGHSAGGHLAALLATDDSYLKKYKLSAADIRGVMPISGVFDVSNERLKGTFGDEESRKKASPLTHVKKDLPPFLVFYADKEIAGLGKQAERFGKALKEAGATAEVKMIKGRDHGSIMFRASDANDEVAKAIFAFIKENSKTKGKD